MILWFTKGLQTIFNLDEVANIGNSQLKFCVKSFKYQMK